MLGFCKISIWREEVAFKQIRKIVLYGKSSNSVVLTREWLDYYELTNGDELVIFGNQVFEIAPKHLEETARKLIEAKDGNQVGRHEA